MSSKIEIPAKMKAVQFSKPGGPEVIEFNEVDVPKPEPEQLLIKVQWGGVNYIDTYHRSGIYNVPLPYTLGQESTGTIVQLPAASSVLENEAFKRRDLKVGDEVVVMAPGSYAQYVRAPWSRVVKLPSSVDPRAGAAFLQGVTAITALVESHPVKKGDAILIHAIAGGLGLMLAQIGKLMGATVIGTTSTAEKAEIAKQNGADHVILYTQSNVAEQVKKITNNQGVAVVYDGVGKDTWETSLEVAARKGTVVFIGAASGPVPDLNVLKLSAKNLKILRPTVFNYLATPEETDLYAKTYFDHLLKDGLKVKFHKEYPFSAEGVRQSQIDITGRGTIGKLLINVGGVAE